jgi:hypothetical protein
VQSTLSVANHSPPAGKIKLFRSLFRGREDVYPRRFESRKAGKSGYAPACANEWVRGGCEKPQVIGVRELRRIDYQAIEPGRDRIGDRLIVFEPFIVGLSGCQPKGAPGFQIG